MIWIYLVIPGNFKQHLYFGNFDALNEVSQIYNTGCFTNGVIFHIPHLSANFCPIKLKLDSNERGSSIIYENNKRSQNDQFLAWLQMFEVVTYFISKLKDFNIKGKQPKLPSTKKRLIFDKT